MSYLQFLFILSSLASLFNRSAVRICSPMFLVYLASTRVGSIPSCPLYSLFIDVQTPRFTWFPCFYFLPQCSQLCSTPLCSFFQVFHPLRDHGFTRLSKKQLCFTSPLPFPLLSGAILDLGTRSSCSGGVL